MLPSPNETYCPLSISQLHCDRIRPSVSQLIGMASPTFMSTTETPSPFGTPLTVPLGDLSGLSEVAHANAMSNANVSRRPPRKSTLTQQQKNQKRQRATQEQLTTLEVEFNKNPTPTATVRERIAADINMTERSVQIWFQNR